MTPLRDAKGREIEAGDVLKVFHFTGARRKRHFMYKQAVAYVVHDKGVVVAQDQPHEPDQRRRVEDRHELLLGGGRRARASGRRDRAKVSIGGQHARRP